MINIKTDYENDSSHIEDVNKTFNWGNNFIKNTVDAIINSYENYEYGYTTNIYFARWI